MPIARSQPTQAEQSERFPTEWVMDSGCVENQEHEKPNSDDVRTATRAPAPEPRKTYTALCRNRVA